MEDHKQSRTEPDAKKKEKILELTKEMELADQDKHKVYDLTEGSDRPEILQRQESTAPASPPPADTAASQSIPSIADAPAEDPAPDTAADAPLQPDIAPLEEDTTPVDMKASPSDAPFELEPEASEETIEPQEIDRRADIGDITPEPELTIDETASPQDTAYDTAAEEEISTIENEVDAAFDEVQSKPTPDVAHDESNDQLFDKLSGITQMVDSAVREMNQDDTPQETAAEPINDTTLTSDAAELEAAISGADDEEEIIELVDIVDPAEAMSIEERTATEEDDIIDLVDIVDPAELEDEALESADGSTSGETADQTDSEGETPTVLEQETELVPEVQSQPAETPNIEEELALSDMDDFDSHEVLVEDSDQEDDFDPTELDNLFVDDDLLKSEDAAGVVESTLGQEDEDDEQIILLSDVLREGSEVEAEDAAADEPLIEDIDMEADSIRSAPPTPNAEEREDLSHYTIEATVEHLLKTKYADTIQQMVADAVQEAVAREVKTIKKGLSDKND